MANFKTQITTLLERLVAPKSLSPKDVAVRSLGISYELVRLGEKGKKDAKEKLIGLGVIEDGVDGLIFDSKNFQLTASTAQSSKMLNSESVLAALKKANLPEYKVAAIMADAFVDKKAAVSYKVEQKK